MQTITKPTQAKRLNLHEFAEQLVYNALAQNLSVNGQDAIGRVSAACQYIQSDTNIVLQEMTEADLRTNWGALVAAMLETNKLKSRKEAEAFAHALKAQRGKALRDWKNLDKEIFATAKIKEADEETLKEIINVVEIYNDGIPATDIDSSVLSVIQIWCKDMPTDKQRNFARLLTKNFEVKQMLQLAK